MDQDSVAIARKQLQVLIGVERLLREALKQLDDADISSVAAPEIDQAWHHSVEEQDKLRRRAESTNPPR